MRRDRKPAGSLGFTGVLQDGIKHGFSDSVSSGWRVRSRALASNAPDRRETDTYNRIVDQLADVDQGQSDALLQAEQFRNSYAGAGGGLDADITAGVEKARVDAFDTINENREAFPQYDGDGPVTEKVAADQRLEYERQFMEREADRKRTITGHIGSIVGEAGGVLGQPEVILTAVIGTAIPAFGGYGLARSLGFEGALNAEGILLSEEKVRKSHKEVGLSRTDSDLLLEMTMAVAGTFAVGYGLKYGLKYTVKGAKATPKVLAGSKQKAYSTVSTIWNKVSPEGRKKILEKSVKNGTITEAEAISEQLAGMQIMQLKDVPGDTTIDKLKNLKRPLKEAEDYNANISKAKSAKSKRLKADAAAKVSALESDDVVTRAKAVEKLYKAELESMDIGKSDPIRKIQKFIKDKDAYFEKLKQCMLGDG